MSSTSAAPAASSASTSGGGGGTSDLEAGNQENDPAADYSSNSQKSSGFMSYRFKNKLNKLNGTLAAATCESATFGDNLSSSRPTTESTVLSSSSCASVSSHLDSILSSSSPLSDNELTNNNSLDLSNDEEENQDDEEEMGGIKADDGVNDISLSTNEFVKTITSTTINTTTTTNTTESFMNKFDQDYDGQVEQIADQATSIISDGSFFDCGLYQFISFIFVSIAWTIGNGWYAYVSVFSGYTPSFECDLNEMQKLMSTNFTNLTQHPTDPECSVLNAFTNETIKCQKWLYDKSQLTATIITEFDLVCDKNYYFELAYSLEQIGYIIGTLIFSYVADKIGRKPVFVGVIISMSVLGIVQYFVLDLMIYFIIGFVINSLACGLEAVCVTLVLEMFSTSKRTLFGIGIEIVWVLILASMSPLAYVIQTWREIRLAIFFVLACLSIASFWLVQESIRWLISVEKLEKAELIVNRISKYNKLNKKTANSMASLKEMFNQLSIYNKFQLNKITTNEELLAATTADETAAATVPKRTTSQVIDIVKHPKFRLYVIIMALNWFATALVYDGLTYLNNYIGENIFFNWIAMNMIELPAQFVCYIVLSRYGRRLTTCVTLVLVGFILLLTCLDTIQVIADLAWFKLILFVLAKFIITQSYSAVILHAPELFPTNLRSFGYGISLFSGKVTACISPMISIYLGKIYPILPAIIYGLISVICGFISLYVPETLNRPLPNSIEDVLKWPRTLTPQEWKAVDELNRKEFDFKKVKECLKSKLCCRDLHHNEKQRNVLSQSMSSLLIVNVVNNNNNNNNNNSQEEIVKLNKSCTLPLSLSSSSALTTSFNKNNLKSSSDVLTNLSLSSE